MSERMLLLKEIQQLNFMMVEAGLFLNNQSGKSDALASFAEYRQRYLEKKAEYESRFGPLTYDAVDTVSDGWSWIEGPWPWEVEEV